MEKLLIGCDDAGNIILWNVEDFSHSSLRVDEPIKQLSLFHYNDLNNNKQRVLVAAGKTIIYLIELEKCK